MVDYSTDVCTGWHKVLLNHTIMPDFHQRLVLIFPTLKMFLHFLLFIDHLEFRISLNLYMEAPGKLGIGYVILGYNMIKLSHQ